MFFFSAENEYEPVINQENNTSFKAITIRGLFGKEDVTLTFEKTVNIYIGENGLGKTTILNTVYYVLTGDYEKLVNIPFDMITVRFSNEKEMSISKADIAKYVNSRNPRRHFKDREIELFIEDYLDQIIHTSSTKLDENMQEMIVSLLANKLDIPYAVAIRYVSSYLSTRKNYKGGNEKNINKMRDNVSEFLNEKVIYLTTYRRIEKDYSDYFNPEKERFGRLSDDSLIRFGMKDVSNAINNVLRNIRDKTNQEFNKMTGILLSKYANVSTDSMYSNTDIDQKLLKIVLDRLGRQIEDNDKSIIMKLAADGNIYDSKYKYLYDLIFELIRIYNQLRIFDDKIMMFKDTCNRYLNDKEFVYNQSEITLKLLSKGRDSEIELSMLSSGEKQIVSLFSRLYLESEKKCILLIDEPELSISMRWQKMLLPDIIRTNNCSLLLAVTHSPFIFDNEFDSDAHDMWYCFDNRSED